MVRAVLPLVVGIALAGCASTGGTPRPFPTPGSHAGGPPAATPARPAAGHAGDGTGYAIAGTALGLRGRPYRSGGHDPSGFDCSGLVEYVFAQHGLSVPRTVDRQFKMGRQVAPEDVQPGDLVFFKTTGSGVSHVGIAIGGDQFVDAPSGSGTVRVERLSAPYWSSRLVAVKRVA